MDPDKIVRKTKEDLERRQALWEDVSDKLKVDFAQRNKDFVSKSRQLNTLLTETDDKHKEGRHKAQMMAGK